MAGEDRFQLGTGGQLQAVQGGGAEEGLADDPRLQLALRRVHQVVRAQQDVYRAAGRQAVGAIAADHAEFGLHRIGAEQLAANEVALADEAGDEGRQRLVVEVVGSVPLFQVTFLEHADVVADGEGFFLVVGHQDRAGAACLEDLANLLAEAAAQFHVEVGEGFVEQQQQRFGRQRAGQGHPLLLAAGEFVGVARGEVVELDQLQKLAHQALALWMLADAEADVVGHAEMGEQRVVLEHHADPAFLRRQGEAGTRDDFAAQLDLPGQHRLEAGDGAQGGGLAASRRTQQAADVSGIEVQVEVLHDFLRGVAAGEIFQVQQQVVAHGLRRNGRVRSAIRGGPSARADGSLPGPRLPSAGRPATLR